MRPALKWMVLVLIALVTVPLLAQKEPFKYDAKSEVTLKGTVEDVKEMDMGKGEIGIHLMVKVGDTVTEVRLCPLKVLDNIEVKFAKGDTVEVTGSKAKVGETEVILARQVVRGTETLVLRDKKGEPVWMYLAK